MRELSPTDLNSNFSGVERVLLNPEKFKLKLGIGRDAYLSLRAARSFSDAWQLVGVYGAAAKGAAFAQSSFVASTFFAPAAPTGVLAWFGLAAAAPAATPAAVVALAALTTGGAVYGVTRMYKSYVDERVEEVPKFLNTALDILASSSFDFIGNLALKIAVIDGDIDKSEIETIRDYFAAEWGFDPDYLDKSIPILIENIERNRLTDMTKSLAEFAINNPDCNFDAIRCEIMTILKEVAEADGILDEREEMAIERIHKLLEQEASFGATVSRTLSTTTKTVSGAAGTAASSLQSAMVGLASKILSKKS